MDDHEKQKLEEFIIKLKVYRGSHTELVSVLIPAGYAHFAVSKQLEAEKSTAKNIKSTGTRNNVTDALERIIRFLKSLDKTPANGIAIYCGNISQTEGQDDLQLFEIEPPMPLNIRLYRCDKEFVLEPLEEMLKVNEVYGLVVMDRKEATIGLLEGKRIKVIEHMTSGVPSKVRAGGQCLAPDTVVNVKGKGEIKIIEVKKGDLILGINFTTMKPTFNKCINKWSVKKRGSLLIITNGVYPSSEINVSLDHTFFVYNKNNIVEKVASDLKVNNLLIGENGKMIKILSIDNVGGVKELIDVEVENRNFFANGLIVHNSAQRFHRITEGLVKEFFRRISERMKEVFFEMPKLKGIIIGGPIPTKEEFIQEGQLVTKLKDKIIGVRDIGDADESGLKELVAKSQDILSQQESIKEKKLLERFFENLSRKPELVVYGYTDVKKALEYGAVETLLLSKSVKKEWQQELKDMALSISATVELVSVDTTEGEQFFNLSGIGALLRFGI